MSTSLAHAYRYHSPSTLDGGVLHLATSSAAATPDPWFFVGNLARPDQAGRQLVALMAVVRARYHIPPAMLARILLEADPVVTAGAERLRFEGFSACCSAYARVDLLPDALRGELTGHGTTNVDFNAPMLGTLATLRPGQAVRLEVGREGVALTTDQDRVVERKVRLPLRWIRGLLEVQAVQRRMDPVFEVPGPEARRFLATLPRMKTHRRETFAVPAGRGLRVSQVRPRGPHVRVGGLERLRALERIVAGARRMRVFADPGTGASAWVLEFDDSRFTLALSPEVWRGFSGEGQALDDLSGARDAVSRVRAALRWDGVIDADAVSRSTGVPADAVHRALAVLGTQGLVGFDLVDSAWFHRVLPFDLSAVEALQPRLRAARTLVDDGGVRLEPAGEPQVAWVRGTGVEHRVVLDADSATCTCTWFARHQHTRGPCSHALAARLVLEEA